MLRIPNVLRIALVLLGALASMATSQVEPGDRAGGGEPSCPADETCSDATPMGLYFAGTPTGDKALFASEWPKATALGGTQTIRLYLDEDGTRPLDLPFSATVDRDALSITDQGDAEVSLRGERAGSSLLRIAEPDTDLLYDRITLETRAVSRFELIPAGRALWYDLELLSGDYELAVLTGGEARVTAALYAADDTRVIDESMSFDEAAGVSADPIGYVDTVLVAPEQPGPIDVTVHAGGEIKTLSVRGVDAADRIVSLQSADPIEVSAGGSATVCFRAESQGDPVLGASWSYRIGSRATLQQLGDEEAAQCIQIDGTVTGADTLTVSAAGIDADFPVQVRESTAASARPRYQPIPPALAGDRAASAPPQRIAAGL